MYSTAATSSRTSSKPRKANTTELKFTFREAKKVAKNNTPKDRAVGIGRIAARRNELEDEKTANDTKRLLARLGASAEEQDAFISLSTSCNVGRQDLNKHSLRLLFGGEGAAADEAAWRRTRESYAYSDDDYNTTGGYSGAGGNGFAGRFLRMTDGSHAYNGCAPVHGTGKKAKTELGSTLVYFLTLAVSTSSNVGNSTRKLDTVFLCFPPRNGTHHDTKVVHQERIADLMIMKLYFVARYVYKTLREEIPPSSAATTKKMSSISWRFPVIVIRRGSATGVAGAHDGGTWYRILKEKLAKGEDVYARRLSLNFYCNVI